MELVFSTVAISQRQKSKSIFPLVCLRAKLVLQLIKEYYVLHFYEVVSYHALQRRVQETCSQPAELLCLFNKYNQSIESVPADL